MLYRTGDYISDQAIAVDQARRGVDIMAQEIRNARYGEDGSYPIELAGSKEFVFTATSIMTEESKRCVIIWQR